MPRRSNATVWNYFEKQEYQKIKMLVEHEIKEEPLDDPLDISMVTSSPIELQPEDSAHRRSKRKLEPEENVYTILQDSDNLLVVTRKNRSVDDNATRKKKAETSKSDPMQSQPSDIGRGMNIQKPVIISKANVQSKALYNRQTKIITKQTPAPKKKPGKNGPSSSRAQRKWPLMEMELVEKAPLSPSMRGMVKSKKNSIMKSRLTARKGLNLDEGDLGSDTEFTPVEPEDVVRDHDVMYCTTLHVPRQVWSTIDHQLDENDYLQLAKEFKKDDDADTLLLPPDSRMFHWSSDFARFDGKREEFKGSAGPQHVFNVPYDSFTAIWDLQIITLIANKTNDYARHRIACSKQPNRKWTDTNANEIYILLALFTIIKWRKNCDIYFDSSFYGIPLLKQVMTYSRFMELIKFMHFVDNTTLSNLKGDELKVAKLKPIAEHCSKKFEALYLPYQKIAIHDSMPLYTGQYMDDYVQAKLTGVGKRIFECYDTLSGYVWRLLVHTGRCQDEYGAQTVLEQSYAADIIMKLTKGIRGRGHTLFIDNCLNSPALARTLKRSGMDVVGLLHPARRHVPQDIKQLEEDKDEHKKGHRVSRHCGDLSINSWVELIPSRYYDDYNKVVNILSTFHTDWPVPVGANVPAALTFYEDSFQAMDRRDNKLCDRESDNDINTKWYMQAFVRILNVSLWNAFLLYSMNNDNTRMSFLAYKLALCNNIMDLHLSEDISNGLQNKKRLSEGSHFPCAVKTLSDRGKIIRGPVWRCALCKLRGVLKTVEYGCGRCEIGLCIENCFTEYHTLEDLS